MKYKNILIILIVMIYIIQPDLLAQNAKYDGGDGDGYSRASFYFSHIDFGAPASFTAIAGGIKQINLEWEKNSENYDVIIAYNTTNDFGSPVGSNSYSVGDAITGGGIVIYNDSGTMTTHDYLSEGVTYYYMAWSTNSNNYSSSSLTANATTTISSNTVLSSFSANTGGIKQIDLEWSKNSQNDDAIIAYNTDGTFGVPLDGASYSVGDSVPGGGTIIYNGSGTSETKGGLSEGITYYFKAWSVNNNFYSSNALTGDASTNASSITVASNLSAAETGLKTVTLNWNQNSSGDNVILAYNTSNIFGTPIDESSYSVGGSISGGGTVIYKGSNTSTEHLGLVAGETYYYKAWSFHSNNYSAGITATVSYDGLDYTPTNLTAAETGLQTITISWDQNASSDDVLLAYNTTDTFGEPVDETSYSAGGSIPGGGTVLIKSGSTSYQHENLSASTTYYYKAWSVYSNYYSSGITGNASISIGADEILARYTGGDGDGYNFAKYEIPSNTNDLYYSSASFIGETAGDLAGYSVSGVGDVDGDGFDDFIIGAKGRSETHSAAGQTYLILGKVSGWAKDVDLSTASASFIGEDASDNSGYSVSGAGDVNGDGYDDFIISAPFAELSRGSKTGITYLIFGRETGRWAIDTDLSTASASFVGEGDDDESGTSIAGVGDVNGDGFDDFIIGAPKNDDAGADAGKIYLILGKSGTWAMDTDLRTASVVAASFKGEVAGDKAGSAISGVGDVNGDGFSDFLIGAAANEEAGHLRGQSYLIFGKSSGWSENVSLGTVGVAGASFLGEANSDLSGSGVSGAGDVNGDGYDDFIIGSHHNGSSAGQAYLMLGKATASWEMDTPLSSSNPSFQGEAADDFAGLSSSGIGDKNGDGYDDFVIGARENSANGTSAGKAYLVYGKSGDWSTDSDVALSTADESFWGEAAGDKAGNGLANAGDVNGDGFDDFLIGSYGNLSSAGKAYLILSTTTGSTNAAYQNFIADGNPPPSRFNNAGVTIDFSSITSSSGYLTVTVHNNQDPAGATGAVLNRYMTISPTGLSDFTFDIVFKYTDAEATGLGGAESNMVIYRNDGSGWVALSTTVDTEKNILTATGQTAFSDWAIGSSEDPLPVELTTFEGYNTEEGVLLTWETATETNNYGFNVELRIENGEWETKGFIEGNGNSNSPKSYTFTDTELPDTSTVSYRLKQIDNDGTFAYSKTIDVDLTNITGVEEEEIPIVYSLSQNYPNPFNPTTTIKFGLPEQGFVDLRVYNILGQEIVNLVNKELTAGYHEINFGFNNIASGVYIYRIDVKGKFSSIKKMLMIK